MKSKLFTVDYTLIFLAAGLMRVCYQMQNTMMPLYGGVLGYSATQIGLSTTVCTIASLILRPMLGNLLDKYGRRWIALIGTALFALATFLCGICAAFPMLLLLRGLQGLGFSSHTTAINTMATDVIPEERMTEGIGYMGLTSSISHAIAPALALYLIADGNYGMAFAGAALAGVIAVVSIFFVRAKKPEHLQKAKDTEKARGLDLFFERQAIRPALLMLLLSACFAGLTTFLATYALSKGFTKAEVGIYFTVNACATAAARLCGGRISDRLGRRWSVLIASAMCLMAFLLIPLAKSTVWLWIAAALHGLGYGTIYPMLNAMAVTQAPLERRGTAMATFLTGMDIGGGIGASVCGMIIDLWGMESMFFICAGITAGAYIAFRLMFPYTAREKQASA